MFLEQLKWTRDPSGSRTIEVARHQAYALLMEEGASTRMPSLLREVSDTESVFVVTDSTVASFHLAELASRLQKDGLSVDSLVLEDGESTKSWDSAGKVLRWLSSSGAKRRSILVAFGGGVICDLVGYVGSMYMRGIPVVNVPTSLMAQLDAAIGGKTGIDFGGTKNLVGSFYHPAGIIIDPAFLTTLPQRGIKNGLAEAVKMAILVPDLLPYIESLRPDQLRTPGRQIEKIVVGAVLGKLDLLRNDPFERSLARLLNLGHTVGHALEAATNFATYQHGEAVAIGIAVASQVSFHRGLCSASTKDRILTCLKSCCGLEVHLPTEYAARTWSELEAVRRIRNGRLHEVLPVRVGECAIVDEVSIAEYADAAAELDAIWSTTGSELAAGSGLKWT